MPGSQQQVFTYSKLIPSIIYMHVWWTQPRDILNFDFWVPPSWMDPGVKKFLQATSVLWDRYFAKSNSNRQIRGSHQMLQLWAEEKICHIGSVSKKSHADPDQQHLILCQSLFFSASKVSSRVLPGSPFFIIIQTDLTHPSIYPRTSTTCWTIALQTEVGKLKPSITSNKRPG